MVKFGLAFSGLLAGLIMAFVEFDPKAVTASAMTGMRLFYSILPVTGVILAICVMWRYDISESKAASIRKALEERRKQQA